MPVALKSILGILRIVAVFRPQRAALYAIRTKEQKASFTRVALIFKLPEWLQNPKCGQSLRLQFHPANHNGLLQSDLADESSIFTARTYAITLALQHAHRSSEHNFLIISDSLSALQALISNESDHPLVVKIHKIHAALIERNKDICLYLAPCHSGIPGNVRADQAAKAACQSLFVGCFCI
ncbi:hypothetical protein C0Q70_07461 [Pomacea canaliculata]|uniref:Uncharacterized protein n=1 Tax=Pomacea canaliculata TaxID=400727 RepID=A0A2T7PF34_POMCA|nr:hypothetical protein C0Q70_07461 [Pomacea canaliculata]